VQAATVARVVQVQALLAQVRADRAEPSLDHSVTKTRAPRPAFLFAAPALASPSATGSREAPYRGTTV